MMRWLWCSILLLFSVSSFSQTYTFKLRKRPALEFFLFADGYFKENLEEKSKEKIEFEDRIYIQLYANDTFLIHWSQNGLEEESKAQNYFVRDTNTFVGAYRSEGGERIKLSFPYKGKTYNMFDMKVEPLIQKNIYKVSKESKKKRISYAFDFDGKVNILADVKEDDEDAIFEFDDLQQRSRNITFGFFSNDLYKEKADQNVPLNIVKTFPTRFILANAGCHSNLFWNGVQQTRTLGANDTTFLANLPEENIVSMDGNNLTFYVNRRYVYLHNDSQIVVTDLNRSCENFFEFVDTVNSLTPSIAYESRDGVKDFLVKMPQKNRYGWVSTYGCAVKWKIIEERKIAKILEDENVNVFDALNTFDPLSNAVLSEYCDFKNKLE